VHPYTFRNEDTDLAWTWAEDPYKEMAAFLEVEQIDGLFTDFTATAVAMRAWVMGSRAVVATAPGHSRRSSTFQSLALSHTDIEDELDE
jgi:hypothetical protein